MKITHRWIKIGALMGALAIVLGAFGAHVIGGYLTSKYAGMKHEVLGRSISSAEKYLGDFKTATLYLMFHALAIVATGILMTIRPKKSLVLAQWCFFLGTVFFSGSLYVLVLSGIRWMGAITPIGGLLFIVGWLALVEGSCGGVASTDSSLANSGPVSDDHSSTN